MRVVIDAKQKTVKDRGRTDAHSQTKKLLEDLQKSVLAKYEQQDFNVVDQAWAEAEPRPQPEPEPEPELEPEPEPEPER